MFPGIAFYYVIVDFLIHIALINFLQDFFKYLAKHSGYDVVNLTNVWSLQDTLFVEVINMCTCTYTLQNL